MVSVEPAAMIWPHSDWDRMDAWAEKFDTQKQVYWAANGEFRLKL